MRKIVLLLCGLMTLNLAHSTEYFVSPNGQDSDPGTELLPWQSLTWGIAQINFGDILTLRAGVYRLLEEPGLTVINKPQLTIQGYAVATNG